MPQFEVIAQVLTTDYTRDEVLEWQRIADDSADTYRGMRGAWEPWKKLSQMLKDYAELMDAP